MPKIRKYQPKDQLIVLIAIGLLIAGAAQAGSERLVMVMSPGKMAQQRLIHLQLEDRQGHALQSDILKRLELREGSCDAGRVYQMPEDYRFGFSPPPARQMGLYLPPQSWQGHTLCLIDPHYGRLTLQLKPAESGRSLVRRFP